VDRKHKNVLIMEANMNIKLSKVIVTCALLITIIIPSTVVNAKEPIIEANDFENSNNGWSESVTSSNANQLMGSLAVNYTPTWVLTATGSYSVASGTINMSSYVETFLNDTKLCKATTTHSTSLDGYVRARFESIFGIVITGSDSYRVSSFTGTTATSPANPDTEGWNGVAHTYCGEK
jgi:outer membrane protease